MEYQSPDTPPFWRQKSAASPYLPPFATFGAPCRRCSTIVQAFRGRFIGQSIECQPRYIQGNSVTDPGARCDSLMSAVVIQPLQLRSANCSRASRPQADVSATRADTIVSLTRFPAVGPN